jgi:hypothetical protein
MKVMYAGEIHCLFQDDGDTPIVVLYSKESEGYILLKYFDLKSMTLKSGCLTVSKGDYSTEPYPLYKLENYKLADMLYHYQILDKVETSAYSKVCDIIKLSKKFKGYSALVDGLEEKLKSFCNHIDSLEYQYEKDLKQISDTLLDDLLKEDYLSILHTHFDIGEH